MIGVEAPETCWATHKRQVINLWNCCIWFVNLFELSHYFEICGSQSGTGWRLGYGGTWPCVVGCVVTDLLLSECQVDQEELNLILSMPMYQNWRRHIEEYFLLNDTTRLGLHSHIEWIRNERKRKETLLADITPRMRTDGLRKTRKDRRWSRQTFEREVSRVQNRMVSAWTNLLGDCTPNYTASHVIMMWIHSCENIRSSVISCVLRCTYLEPTERY